MSKIFDLWQLLAGVAFFLLGMHLLEDALKKLSGRSFKIFLKKQTSHKLRAIAGGAVVTGILQSSSVVNLMVLAFVGAGIMNMNNALAVILGANLGTTLYTWFVATVGFRVNIEMYALPVVGIAGILMAILKQGTKWHTWCSFIFGIGLLFVGLEYMKVSVADAVKTFDFSVLNDYPSIVFVLAGFILTSLIQSSSATVVIVLSILHAKGISLYAATAIVLGSEVGTTVKLLIASAGGSSIKKRVALGNFLFNTISIAVIFIFLMPVNKLISNVIGIKDQLIALSFFQTFINLISVICFFPFLNAFGNFLNKRFKDDEYFTGYIDKVAVTDAELAIQAMEKEAQRYLQYVLHFCRNAMQLGGGVDTNAVIDKEFSGKTLAEQYEYIKHLQGDIYAYYISLQKESTSKEETARIDALISSARNSMYAAKSMKDTIADIEQLHNSSNETKYGIFQNAQKLATGFYGQLQVVMGDEEQARAAGLQQLFKAAQDKYDHVLKNLYTEGTLHTINEVEVATIINFYRELYTVLKSTTTAARDLLLPPQTAEGF